MHEGSYGCVFHPSLTVAGSAPECQKRTGMATKIVSEVLSGQAKDHELTIGRHLRQRLPAAQWQPHLAPVAAQCELPAKLPRTQLMRCSAVEQLAKRNPQGWEKVVRRAPLLQMPYAGQRTMVNAHNRWMGKLVAAAEKKKNKKKPPPPQLSRQYLRQLQRTLRHTLKTIDLLHQADIVHGDLSLANLVMSKSGRPILIDFGTALDLRPLLRDGHRAGDAENTLNMLSSLFRPGNGMTHPLMVVLGMLTHLRESFGVEVMARQLEEVKLRLTVLVPAMFRSEWYREGSEAGHRHTLGLLQPGFVSFNRYVSQIAAVLEQELAGARTLDQLLDGVVEMVRRNWQKVDLFAAAMLWLQMLAHPRTGLRRVYAAQELNNTIQQLVDLFESTWLQ